MASPPIDEAPYPCKNTDVGVASGSGEKSEVLQQMPTLRNTGLWSRSGHLGKSLTTSAAWGILENGSIKSRGRHP